MLKKLNFFAYLFVFPADGGLARVAIDIGNGVQTSKEVAFFGRTCGHVDHSIEQVGSALAALKRLGNEIVVVGQMRATMNARVGAFILSWQIHLECLYHFFFSSISS